MNKEEIRKACFIGLSEDLNGEFYPIYDFNKLYQMIVDKTSKWLEERTMLGIHPNEGKQLVSEYQEFINH